MRVNVRLLVRVNIHHELQRVFYITSPSFFLFKNLLYIYYYNPHITENDLIYTMSYSYYGYEGRYGIYDPYYDEDGRPLGGPIAPPATKKVFICSDKRFDDLNQEMQRMERLPYFIKIELESSQSSLVANLPIATKYLRKLDKGEIRDVNKQLKKELKKYDPDSKVYRKLIATQGNLDEVAKDKYNLAPTGRGRDPRVESSRAGAERQRLGRRRHDSESEDEESDEESE